MPSTRAPVDKRKFLMTFAVTLIAGAMLWQARDFPDRVSLFPTVIMSALLVLCVVDLVRIVRPALVRGSGAAGDTRSEATDGVQRDHDPPRQAEMSAPQTTSTAGAVGWFFVLVVPTLLFGFLLSVPIYMALFLRMYGKHSWRTIGILVASTLIVIYGGFVRLLDLPIYSGYLL